MSNVVDINSKKKKMSVNEFLNHCTACGGNWAAMLMTGIKELFPDLYELLDDDREYTFDMLAALIEDRVDLS